MPDGSNRQLLDTNIGFEQPSWSKDERFLYGLSEGPGLGAGYPAYWDTQEGQFGICKRNLPYFTQIQGADNPDNPYEVIVQDVWLIITIDISKCKVLTTLIDYSDQPGQLEIVGFSYNSATQELVYGLVVEPYTQNRGYRLMYQNMKSRSQMQLAEGINPSWSPDGNQAAYIGLNGLYVYSFADAVSRVLVQNPFFLPWESGSPAMFITVPSWSPDGEWLVYHRCNNFSFCQPEEAKIYKVNIKSLQEEIVLTGGQFPNWRP